MAAGSAIATALIALVTGLPAWHDGRAMAQDSPVVSELAPTGRLRVAINYGNPVLAQKDAGGGAPRGISPELARELARRLGKQIEYIEFDSAGATFEALKRDLWDVGFLAIDLRRAEELTYSAPMSRSRALISSTPILPSSRSTTSTGPASALPSAKARPTICFSSAP